MTKESHAQIARLDADVQAMAELARRMLADSLDALERLDPELAAKVIALDAELARRDAQIEQDCLQVLMLHQPVARDLRRIAATLKIITYLARIGRYGYDIARLTGDLPKDAPVLQAASSLRGMMDNVERMLDLVINAFSRHRDAPVPDVMALEEQVDQARWAVWRESLAYMMADPKHIETGAQLMMVARYLERCGDNCVKMLEKVHYAATGERIQL